MARRFPFPTQQCFSVLLRRGPPQGARLCREQWLQRGLSPRIHQNFYSTQPVTGKKSDEATIAIPKRRPHTIFHSRLLVLIASATALLLWNAFAPPTNKTRFDGHSFINDDRFSKVDLLLRRAAFYAEKDEHAEVYEATQLALQECNRLGLRTDEPFVLRIFLNSARALFKQGQHEEALERLQQISETCMIALRDLDEKGIDADEVSKDYLDRSSKIPRDMTFQEYDAFQWGRMSWFKLQVESSMMSAQILSVDGNEDQAVDRVISVVVAIEKEMKHDYSRAPDFPDPYGSLSKLEIFSVLELLRSVLMWRSIDRALPFSQRILALMQSTEADQQTCAVVDAMRWLAINLSGYGAELELREGNRTAKVSQLYTEARQWAEQALETAASIKASGGNGEHSLLGPSHSDEPACEAFCVAILNLLAGMSLFIDKDETEGRRLLEEGLSRSRPLGAHAQMENAEGFLKDLDAGTVGSEETNIRDGELFGYTQRLGRERRKDSTGADEGQREGTNDVERRRAKFDNSE